MSLPANAPRPRRPSLLSGGRALARQIVGSELPGVFSRTLEVPFGQRAVLLDGGRYVATLPPGRHELEGWKRGAGATAILVDGSAIPWRLDGAELSSSDHQRLRVTLELSLRVTTPEVFVAQQVRDRGQYTLDEFQAEIASAFLWVVEELVTSRGVGELTHQMGRERLRLDLLTRLQPICERSGLLLERLSGLLIEAPDHAAAERFEQQAKMLRAEYECGIEEMKGGRARLKERLLRESLELEHDIASRRKVAEQKLEERQWWFEQQRVEQSFARQEQMKKLWEMARIHEMQKERKQERLLARGSTGRGKTAPAAPLEPGTFQATQQGAAIPPARPQPPMWRRCPAHGIKYDLVGGDCPLCEREQRGQGRGGRG